MMSCLPDDQDDHNVKIQAAAMLEMARSGLPRLHFTHNVHFADLNLGGV